LQSTAHFVYPTHTHTALNRSGTWRTGRGPETAGLHVRRRDVAAAGITPDCIQSLYLSLAKTAHYTQNHSTPIYPHDLERMRRALPICYCVNPKYLEFTLAFQMHHDWHVKFNFHWKKMTRVTYISANPYIMLIMNISITYTFF